MIQRTKTMSPERWEHVKKIVWTALKRSSQKRPKFLEEACAEDSELFDEVTSLLAMNRAVGSFLERPALELLRRELTRL